MKILSNIGENIEPPTGIQRSNDIFIVCKIRQQKKSVRTFNSHRVLHALNAVNCIIQIVSGK